MNTHPMKLVTIVCESHARHAVKTLLDRVGARGFTMFPVEGYGSHGDRPADIAEYANVQIEVVAPSEVAEQLLERLEAEFFSRYAMIAFESDIRVLRGDKF